MMRCAVERKSGDHLQKFTSDGRALGRRGPPALTYQRLPIHITSCACHLNHLGAAVLGTRDIARSVSGRGIVDGLVPQCRWVRRCERAPLSSSPVEGARPRGRRPRTPRGGPLTPPRWWWQQTTAGACSSRLTVRARGHERNWPPTPPRVTSGGGGLPGTSRRAFRGSEGSLRNRPGLSRGCGCRSSQSTADPKRRVLIF
jgi:hypothetical protein